MDLNLKTALPTKYPLILVQGVCHLFLLLLLLTLEIAINVSKEEKLLLDIDKRRKKNLKTLEVDSKS
jgi:hypothetical protein